MRFGRFARRRGSVTDADGPPLLGVVVPVYDVEDYLAECLESILAQSYAALDVVVVDDGSPDGSLAIAERFATDDPRVRIVRRGNGGLGAARNTGADAVRGRYLTFVDSDDVVGIGAFEAMVDALEASGSDFAVGKTERLVDGEIVPLPWAEALHAHDRAGIALTDEPRLLRDFYTWNKVFRTSFWRDGGFRFREGVLFEDQPLITDAYCRARAIDVLGHVVYRWRRRTDGSSLTQGMFAPDKIDQRADAIALTRPVVDARGDDTVREAWLWTLMESHFPLYLAATARLEADEPLAAAVAMVRGAITTDDVQRVRGVSALHRVMLHLALGPGPEALRRFLDADGRARNRWPVRMEGDRAVAALPVDDAVGLERSAFALDDEQVAGVARGLGVRWATDGTLRVEGCAYLDPIEVAGAARRVTVDAVDQVDGRRVALDVRPRPASVEAGRWPGPASKRPWIHVADGVFEAVLDPRHLLGDGDDRRWALTVTIRYGVHVREVPLVAEFPGWVVGGPATRWLEPAVTATVAPEGSGALGLHVQHCPVRVERLDETGDRLLLDLASAGGAAVAEVRLSRIGGDDVRQAELEDLGDGRWRAALPASQTLEPQARWRLDAVVDGQRHAVRASEDVLVSAAFRQTRPYLTDAARLRLAPRSRSSVTVTSTGLAAGRLRIGGVVHGEVGPLSARLRRHEQAVSATAEVGADGTFVIDLPLTVGGQALADGRYALGFSVTGDEPDGDGRSVPWRAALADPLPYDVVDASVEVRLLPGADRRFALRLRGHARIGDDEQEDG